MMRKVLICINVIVSLLLLVPIVYYWYSILFFGASYTLEQDGVIIAMGIVWLCFEVIILTIEPMIRNFK